MSTAGKDWNDWAGGPASEVLFVPFILETQAYLSSQGAAGSLTVGTADLRHSLRCRPVRGAADQMVRTFLKAVDQGPAKKVVRDAQFGKSDGAQLSFKLAKNFGAGRLPFHGIAG